MNAKSGNLGARVAQRDALDRLNISVQRVLAWVIAPLGIPIYWKQSIVQPCWQMYVLLASSVLACVSSAFGYRLARAKKLEASVAIAMFSIWAQGTLVLCLRKNNLPGIELSFIGITLYGALVSRIFLYAGSLLSMVTVLACSVLEHLGLLPLVESASFDNLMSQATFAGLAFPLIIFFMRKGEEIHELPFKHLAKTAEEQKSILGLVSRVQPDIEELVGQVEKLSSALAAQAQQQAVTTGSVGRSLEELKEMAQQAVTAAHSSRAIAEKTKQSSTESWERLQAVQAEFRAFFSLLEAIRASSERLSQSSQRTEEIIERVRDVDKQVNVLAINTAIEAARAGEAGKGFGVVANALRSLISQTASNARRARELLEGIRREAADTLKETTSSAEQLGRNLQALRATSSQIQQIIESFIHTSEKVDLIAAVADRQQAQVLRAGQAMLELNESAGHLNRSAATLSESMRRIVVSQDEMKGLVRRFKDSEAPAETRS